jgi:hypothetical protein
MNNHDETVFEKDSLHGLEEPKDKTKTEEDTGNQGGYHGPNRKERDQAQRVPETRQPTDIDIDKDRNWKVVGRKTSTPRRKEAMLGAVERNNGYDKVEGTVCDKGLDKAVGTVRDKGLDKEAVTVRDKGQDKAAGTIREKLNRINRPTYGDAPGGADNNTYKLADDGEQNARGGVKSSTNSGTIEVRFTIDANRRRDFNLCMRLREFLLLRLGLWIQHSVFYLWGEMGGNDHQTGRMAKHKKRNRQVLIPLEPTKQCFWENENCDCLIHDATEEPVRDFLNIPQAKRCSHKLCTVGHG